MREGDSSLAGLGLGVGNASAGPAAQPPEVASQPLAAIPSDREILLAALRQHASSLGAVILSFRLADLVLRWLGILPVSRTGMVATGFVVGAPWLILPLVLTAAFGQWQDAPIWRWVIIAFFLGVYWAVARELASRQMAESVSTEQCIVDDDELRQFVDLAQRWYRLRWTFLAGLAFAAGSLLALRVLGPEGAMTALPVGTLTVLAMALYVSGELMGTCFAAARLNAYESSCTYCLHWRNPLDSRELRAALRGAREVSVTVGLAVAGFVLAVVLALSLGSPLVVPVAILLTLVSYVALLAASGSAWASIHHIVSSAREGRLAELDRRIAGFGPRLAELTADESGELERLAKLRDMVRDTPTSPGTTKTAERFIGSLLIPTITLLATVAAERYADQLLEKVMP